MRNNTQAALTIRQSMGMGAIQALTATNGNRPPTLVEIAASLGIGKASAQQLIRVLKRKGYITTSKGSHRSVRLTDRALPGRTLTADRPIAPQSI